jgi:hypothetical protein
VTSRLRFGRLIERAVGRVYRVSVRLLPAGVQARVRSKVAAVRLASGRSGGSAPHVLELNGSGPVRVVSTLGFDAEAVAARLDDLVGDPAELRIVVVTDDPDLAYLRARAASFEFVPAYDSTGRWFSDRSAYDDFLDHRLAVICASYGAESVERLAAD